MQGLRIGTHLMLTALLIFITHNEAKFTLEPGNDLEDNSTAITRQLNANNTNDIRFFFHKKKKNVMKQIQKLYQVSQVPKVTTNRTRRTKKPTPTTTKPTKTTIKRRTRRTRPTTTKTTTPSSTSTPTTSTRSTTTPPSTTTTITTTTTPPSTTSTTAPTTTTTLSSTTPTATTTLSSTSTTTATTTPTTTTLSTTTTSPTTASTTTTAPTTSKTSTTSPTPTTTTITTTTAPPSTTSTTTPKTTTTLSSTSTTTATTTPTTTTLSTTTTSPTPTSTITTASTSSTTSTTTPPPTTTTITTTTTLPSTTSTTTPKTTTTLSSTTITTKTPPSTTTTVSTTTTKPPTTSTTTKAPTTTTMTTTTAPTTTTTIATTTTQLMTTTTTPPIVPVVFDFDESGMPVEGTRLYKMMCRVTDDKCNCPSSTIQSYDGTCNNLKHRSNGVAGGTFKRVMLPRYHDGKRALPRSVVGNSLLPSSREVSATILGTNDDIDSKRTLINGIYLMFVSQDIQGMIPRKNAAGGNSESCCDLKGNMLPQEILPDHCLPIAISETDRFFSTFGQTCLSYMRRDIAPRCRRSGSAIQQINLRPSYLDLSVLYGSNENENKKLRAFEKGHLKTRLVPSGGRRRQSFLPTQENASEVCGSSNGNSRCYLTANPMVNQISGLAALQTLFVRLHDGIADKLSTLNPAWSDDELYHESRRINIALYHHFTYNEVLPSLLGKKISDGFALSFKNLSHAYDEDVSAEAMSDFAAAISPVVASLLPSKISLMHDDRSVQKEVDLLGAINHNAELEEQGLLDSALRGLTTQPSQAFDRHFAKVFIEREVGPDRLMKAGMDQIAVDIQTGRDLGISTYNDAREYCGLDRAVTFEGFSDTMNEEALGLLRAVYKSPEDVDLAIGLLQEGHYGDGMLGFTGGCLVGEQFTRLRLADRFFANVAGFNHSFSDAQLNSILATKFSSVICEVSDNMLSIQPDAFRPISPTNPLTSCSGLPGLNLAPWLNATLQKPNCNQEQ